jgi:MFS superfamily sulfate permease-like transporter
VIVDLLTGILVGIGLAVLKLVYTFSHLTIRIAEDHSQARTMLHLNGAATFLRLPKLAAALESVPSNVELHVDFEGLTYIDHACLDLLMNWEKVHMASGGSLVIDWDSLTARFHARRNGNGEGRVAEAPPKTAAVEHLGSHREKQYAEAG